MNIIIVAVNFIKNFYLSPSTSELIALLDFKEDLETSAKDADQRSSVILTYAKVFLEGLRKSLPYHTIPYHTIPSLTF